MRRCPAPGPPFGGDRGDAGGPDRRRAALAVFLEAGTEPAYGTIAVRDGPIALGWERWRECEVDYAPRRDG